MATAITGFTPTTPTANPAVPAKSLTGGDFLNLMIQQLSQQDPLNPTDSNQLLTQMSQISQLQSNTDMQTSLQGLTLQQSIGAAGNLIGKQINGIDDTGAAIQGVVTSVKVQNKQVRLELDSGKDLPMENVTLIAPVSAAQSSGLASALPQLQQLLQNSSGSGQTSSSLLNLAKMLGSVSGTAAS